MDNEGNKYEGTFKNDKKNGFGILYYQDGTKYEGDFKEDLAEGKGKITYNNGEVYEGIFRNDEEVEEIGAKTNKNKNAKNDLIDGNSNESNKKKELIDNSGGDFTEC